MTDIYFDTEILAEFLRQYFNKADYGKSPFLPNQTLSKPICIQVNSIIRNFQLFFYRGLIISSCFSFVEIGRKYNEILGNEVTHLQFSSFIEQPPEWFSIEPFSLDIISEICTLPTSVKLSNGEVKPIEGIDNYHAATTKARDKCLLATHDNRLIATYPEFVIF